MIISKGCPRVRLWSWDGIYRKQILLRNATFPGKNFDSVFVAVSDHPLVKIQQSPPSGFRAFSIQPIVSLLRQDVRTLRARTNQWLRIPLETWTAREVSRARYLMEAWNHYLVEEDGNKNTHKADISRAIQQSKILRRWLEARYSSSVPVLEDQHDSSVEIVEMLHQCLSSWRQVGKHGDTMQSVEGAVNLVYLVDAAGAATQDPRARPGDKAYSMCFHILAEHPDYPSLLETLKVLWERRLQVSQTIDLQLYNSFLHALAKCSLYSAEAAPLAEQIFLELSSVGKHTPTATSFVAVMHAWANRGDFESAQRAQAILEQLIAANDLSLLSPEAFNVCIDGWAKTNQPEKAEALLNRMGDFNLEPTTVSFNSAIHAWAKTRSRPEAPQRAEALLRRMESTTTKCQPTLETYTAVLDAWSHTKNPGPKVEKLLMTLEERHASDSSFPAPNKWTYMVAIRAWGATRSAEDGNKEYSPIKRAQELINRMDHLATNTLRRRGLEPCPLVYAALLDGWSQSERSNVPEEVVLELFRKIPARVLTDERSKLVLYKMFRILASRGRCRAARRLLQEAMKSPGNSVLDTSIYNLVMMAHAKSREEDAALEALALLREMERDESSSPSVPFVQATATTYIHAMTAWGNSSYPDAGQQAEDLFWELLDKSQNVVDNSLTVAANCVLRAWSKSREGGAAHRAEAMWKWMEARGGASDHYEIQPDALSCLHMMHAWAHSGRCVGPTKAESYFLLLKDLVLPHPAKEDFVLKAAHFNVLIMAWAKSTAPKGLERIRYLVDEMLNLSAEGHSVLPDEFTERWVAHAAKNEDKTAEAMSILEELRKERAKRNRIDYSRKFELN